MDIDTDDYDAIMEQWYKCRDMAAALARTAPGQQPDGTFRCRFCLLVGDCPIYGTRNYVKRALEFCSKFSPGLAK